MFIRSHSLFLLKALGLLTCSLFTVQAGWAASLVVTNNSLLGAGSLRDAIITANTNAQADTITFAVTPVYNLNLLFDLPHITEGGLTIDGSGTTAIINGGGTPNFFRAFVVQSVAGCTIKNLTVAGAGYGVQLNGGSGHVIENVTLNSNTYPISMWNGATANTVRACTIHSNTNGVLVGSATPTVSVSTNNTFGGTGSGDGNYIYNHAAQAGVFINTTGSNGNIFYGNRIGINRLGVTSANLVGIDIQRGANTIIGGALAGQGNVISGNGTGIRLRRLEASGTQIVGNYIGVAPDGVTSQPNTSIGISISLSARNTTIGGATAAHSNIIANNANGIVVSDAGSLRNAVYRNSIYNNSVFGIALLSSGNTGIAAPTLTTPNPIIGSSTVAVTGTVQFYADTATQGRDYVGQTAVTGGAFSAPVSLVGHEGKNLTATLTDSTGNSSPFSGTILIDITPPTGGLSSADPIVNDNNAVLQITPTPADNFTAAANIDMRFSNDGVTWSAWEPVAATKAWDLHFGVTPSGGVKTVSAQYKDDSENISTIYTTNIEIDITPPSGGGLDSADPIVVDNNAVLLITPAPTDNNTLAANIDMRFSNDGVTWSPWELIAPSKAWDLHFGVAPTGGIKTVSVQFKDDAENISASVTTNIEIDITPPDGGLFLPESTYITPNVTLEINPAPNDNNTPSNLIEMRFSNNGVDWSAWELVAATKAWNLNQDLLVTTDGIRTPRAQFRDEAQNVSATYSISVELDTAGPVVTDFSQIDTLVSDLDEVRYTITFDEPVQNLETGVLIASNDFDLITGGSLAGVQIAEIFANGGNTYTITIDTGTGDGDIRLDFLSLGGINDDHGNPVITGAPGGEYIIDRLAISTDPVGGTATEEDPFSFTVATTGGVGTLHYEWRKNGLPVLGAPDAATFPIASLVLSDAGSYTCEVSDDYISVESGPALLSVETRIPALSGVGLAMLSGAVATAAASILRRKRRN